MKILVKSSLFLVFLALVSPRGLVNTAEMTNDEMNQESRRHHFVPVFYLSRWCGGDKRVHVIRNIGGRIIRSRHSPKHVGFEYHLYSYSENFKVSDRAEIESKFFKPLDNEGARIVSKIISGEVLERRDRILWAQFLTAFKVRVPENVAMIKKRGRKAVIREIESIQADYERRRKGDDPNAAVDWIELDQPGLVDSFGIGQLAKIASDQRAMQDILSFDWHIVDFQNSTIPLLTSDRPCVYTEGLHRPDCVIALPLSPSLAFFAFRSGSRAQRNLMQADLTQLSTRLNESVVGQAAERAYAQSPNDAVDGFFQRCLSQSDLND